MVVNRGRVGGLSAAATASLSGGVLVPSRAARLPSDRHDSAADHRLPSSPDLLLSSGRHLPVAARLSAATATATRLVDLHRLSRNGGRRSSRNFFSLSMLSRVATGVTCR